MTQCIAIYVQKDYIIDYEGVQNVHFNIFLKLKMIRWSQR